MFCFTKTSVFLSFTFMMRCGPFNSKYTGLSPFSSHGPTDINLMNSFFPGSIITLVSSLCFNG